MPLVDIPGRSLYYERRGSGAPLLLVQGMAGHHGLWGEAFLDLLAADFDVITFDHRGIGESTDPGGADFTIAELAADAVALLDALDVDTAHVFGISLGGMVAQRIAIDHPARVRHLVLGCTYCGGPGSHFAAPGPVQMLQAMITGNVDTALRTAFTVNLSPAYTADESRFADFMRASLSVRVPVPVVLRQAKAAWTHDTHAQLPGVAIPTLVLHGTADQMLDHSNGEQIAGLVPGARLHSFADVGHLFWWERPLETVQLTREHCLG